MFYAAAKREDSFNSGPYESQAVAVVKAPSDMGLKKGDHYWIGEGVTPDPALDIDADDVIETICCRLGDTYGDAAEGYLSHVTKEESALLTKKLQQAVREWIKETEHEPEFVGIPAENMKEIVYLGGPGEEIYGRSRNDKHRHFKLRNSRNRSSGTEQGG